MGISSDWRDAPYVTPGLRRWRAVTDGPLLVLAIGSLPLLVLETARERLAHGDQLFLDVVNVVVLVAFGVDYIVELALATRRRQFVRREWTSALIVIAQAVALLPGLSSAGALRALRGARGWRAAAVVARALAIGGAAARDGRAVLRRRAGSFALGVAGMTWISSAVAFTLAEDVGPEGRLHSFGDGLWWASATITTVGYGDVSPITTVGRVVGVITMVVGISTFAIVTAKFAEFLVKADSAPNASADE